ncbi:MAG: SLBB domain-containing protein [Balneola sp.]|nr:SLBB domain-containing protein [Balneola sp.]MBO6650280.1 SLBB domain-containing protein [Balneola sp.]MBO6712134.1 SLBB domain-containing protein [Balneola sp.]MBO6800328.1 SLBB domain-containing protein [Balneola sp.]MBO6869658.1 SLBB domain-containing protein [Balneola sp.]
MFKHYSAKNLLGILFLFICSSFLNAQNNGNQQEDGFNIDLSDVFGGFYYTDPLSVQLASRINPIEASLDLENYVLGVNDLISIKIDGAQSLFLRGILVNPQGDVTLPVVGPVNINGLSISESEKKIEEATAPHLKNASVTITIDSPRPVIYHVTGGVPYPGKYLTYPQSRVDQAIFSSITSGNRDLSKSIPNSSDFLTNDNYSFRSIKIYHSDGTESEADLVKYFRTGSLKSNPFVKHGDLINIIPTNRETPKVSISGAVKADYEFEYKKGDTPALILEFGGGFEETADTTKLFVYRRAVEGIEQIVVEPQDWDSFKLLPNDRVVAPFGDEFDASASAWVYGEVNIPGNFPVVSGATTALELLQTAGGLSTEALPAAAYLVRSGGQKNEIPNQFNADLMKRTSDQYLQGLEYLDAETRLSKNKVYIDLSDNSQLQSLKIFDGDRLYIPRDDQTIFVFGQVNNPGYFGYSNTKTVNEYITQAGGFALSADKDRIFILKAGNATWFKVGETDLSSGDKIFIDRQPVEELNAKRAYDIQKQQLRNQRTQLIMTAITTITGIITTYVAVRRL